jgi:hypothetical protein
VVEDRPTYMVCSSIDFDLKLNNFSRHTKDPTLPSHTTVRSLEKVILATTICVTLYGNVRGLPRHTLNAQNTCELSMAQMVRFLWWNMSLEFESSTVHQRLHFVEFISDLTGSG